MKKEKTLSLILAGLLSLSQIGPGFAMTQKAYASSNKLENEITSESDLNLEDGKQDLAGSGVDDSGSKKNSPPIKNEDPSPANPKNTLDNESLSGGPSLKEANQAGLEGKNEDVVDIDTSLTVKHLSPIIYPGTDYGATWEFTISNNSNRDVYLSEVISPALDNSSYPMISKNIYMKGFWFDRDPKMDEYYKKFPFTIHYTEASGVTGEKNKEKLNSAYSTNNKSFIKSTIKIAKPFKISPKESLTLIVDTEFFEKDYKYPFSPDEWVRKEALTDKDSRCLFNADHSLSLKAKFYYDQDGKKPISHDNLPQGSNFKDQASASFKLDGKVGDLSFGGTTNEPSEILIKKSDENDYEKVSGKAEAKTDKTLRFVAPVKIFNVNEAYQKALKNADQNQYLINPSFLIEKEADDGSLEQNFYIKPKGANSLIELDESTEKIGGKDYYKLTLPANNVSEFMTDFDFVYDVKFKNNARTRGLDKKVKLAFDNLGKVIDTKDDDLIVELKADYLEATKVYKVDFDMDGHGENQSQSIKEGQKAKEPTNPSAEGYSFEGWYADKDLTTAFDFNKEITEDTTIYAKWAKLFDITYKFISGTEGKELPESINDLLENIENKKYKVGDKVEAPDIKLEPVKADGGTWTFEAWDNNEIVVSENGENNKFTGKWTFTKKADPNEPKPGDKDSKDKGGNESQPPKPGDGNGGDTGDKGGEKENPDNPKNPDPDKNKDKDKKDGDKDKPSTEPNPKDKPVENKDKTDPKTKPSSGDKDKKDTDKKDSDQKPSLKPVDAPKEKVIRVNTDIYRPIPKGYKRLYFDPGKDACLKYNPSFDYGQVIAFDVKETMTFGEAKAEDKGLVIPIAIPKDKSLKFVGWSPKLQADGEFVEGVKYVALYEKIDKAQEGDDKKSGENKAIKKEEKQKENSSKDGEDFVKAEEKKENRKLIKDWEISKKESAKTQNALPNKAKALVKKNPSPRTGVAGLGLVSGILAISSAGLFLSKKSKKD